MYNCGIVQFVAGDRHKAIETLEAAKGQRAGHADEPYSLKCLFAPTIIEEKLVMTEIVDPELFAMLDETLGFLKTYKDEYDTPSLEPNGSLTDLD